MKKEEFVSVLVYLAMFVVALFIGLQIIAPAFESTGIIGAEQYGYAVATILLGFLFNVVLLELAHIAGALIGGYTISMVNILGLALFKIGNRWQITFKAYDGLTGETKIVAKSDKSNPIWNLWFGLVFFLIEFVSFIAVAYFVFPSSDWMRYAFVITAAIGGIIMLYNYMPFKLDSTTDGYRLAMFTKTNVKGDAAYNELIRIEKAYAEGKDPHPIQTFDKVTGVTAQIMLYEIYQLLVNAKYKEALVLIEKILAESVKLPDLMVSRVFSQKVYATLLTQTLVKGKAFYLNTLSSKQKKFLANDLSMESLRAYLLVAGTIEDSQSEAIYVLERKDKALKRSVEPGRRKAEDILFERALIKVKQRHKDWKF